MNLKNIFILFWTYSFLGWVIETTLVSFQNKKFINRGFFLGPYCPIYGTGGVLLLSLSEYRYDYLVVFTLSVFICSLVEYLTSYILELVYRVRWWDYSDKLFNINGRICLFNAICFGVLGVIAVCFLNPFIITNINNLSNSIKLTICLIILIITLTDMIITFNAMFDFRKSVMNLKTKTFSTFFKPNTDSTVEMSKRVRDSLKEKSFIHKHLYKAYDNLRVYKNSFLKRSEDLKKYKILQHIESSFFIGLISSIVLGIILGSFFGNTSLIIIILVFISIIVIDMGSSNKNGK